jgi:citrate synthase
MAHASEQIAGNRIIRPASRYVGDLHPATGSRPVATT